MRSEVSAILVMVCLAGICGCDRISSAGLAESEVNAALRAENEALRRENQLLRRELVARNGVLPESLLPVKVVPEEEKSIAPGEDTGFWMSSNSKVRHNRRCRNYRKVKGRPCGPNDGKPCKMCGG